MEWEGGGVKVGGKRDVEVGEVDVRRGGVILGLVCVWKGAG